MVPVIYRMSGGPASAFHGHELEDNLVAMNKEIFLCSVATAYGAIPLTASTTIECAYKKWQIKLLIEKKLIRRKIFKQSIPFMRFG
ncbi:hypothetical protein AAVH_15910 [Aphelenchoides avenae]|nr:hypothetical protein AAVH_15910 [Aphelenchus avenae]